MSDTLQNQETSTISDKLSDAFYSVACAVNDVIPGAGPALYNISHIIPQSVVEATVAVGCSLGLGK